MSKRVWNPPIPPQEGDTVTAWRSVGEKEGSTTFRNHLDKEFPSGDTLSEEEQKVSRRNFTKLMGASSALAGLGLTSCRRPESYIVPYKQAPEWVIPGKPLFYASTRPRVGGAVPLVVTTFEGRPTKLEPNTDHPTAPERMHSRRHRFSIFTHLRVPKKFSRAARLQLSPNSRPVFKASTLLRPPSSLVPMIHPPAIVSPRDWLRKARPSFPTSHLRGMHWIKISPRS